MYKQIQVIIIGNQVIAETLKRQQKQNPESWAAGFEFHHKNKFELLDPFNDEQSQRILVL